jgi:predicted metal-dependent phosphoesterase TrpH
LTTNVGVLKVELHSHSADDPQDRIPYSTRELIDRAAELGYDALAITLHDRQLEVAPLTSYAMDRGVTLIPGIERTIQGKHVLLLNFSRSAEEVQSFGDLARLREREPGLVVAPHPFFPHPSCLRGLMDEHADLFDAIEVNSTFTASIDFNEPARRWARAHGKPLVGNGDVHRLRQLGTTYSLVEAERNAAAICSAIREGRVGVEARPLTFTAVAGVLVQLFGSSIASSFSADTRRPEYA